MHFSRQHGFSPETEQRNHLQVINFVKRLWCLTAPSTLNMASICSILLSAVLVYLSTMNGNDATLVPSDKQGASALKRSKIQNTTSDFRTVRLPGGLCMPCASGDFECPENLVCSQGHCVLMGRSGGMCPRLMCEKCEQDNNCAQLLKCLAGRCVGAERDLSKCNAQSGFGDPASSRLSGLCGPCIPDSDLRCAGTLKCVANHCVHLPSAPAECGSTCKWAILRKCSRRGQCAQCDGASGPCANGHKCINGYCVRNGLRVESCVPAKICEKCGLFRNCVGAVCDHDGSNCQNVACHSGYCAISKQQAEEVCPHDGQRHT